MSDWQPSVRYISSMMAIDSRRHPAFMKQYRDYCQSTLNEVSETKRITSHLCALETLSECLPFGHGIFFRTFAWDMHGVNIERLGHCQLKITPIIFELIWDELEASSDWLTNSIQYKEDGKSLNYRKGEEFIALDWKKHIIHLVTRNPCINENFDIDTNEEHMLAFLNWVQYGGEFPLILPSIIESLKAQA